MSLRFSSYVMAAVLTVSAVRGQGNTTSNAPTDETVRKLLDRLDADEARIKQLEEKLAAQQATAAPATNNTLAKPEQATTTASQPPGTVLAEPPQAAANTAPAASAQAPAQSQAQTPASSTATAQSAPSILDSTPDTAVADASDQHAHMMELPGGGPALKIRGFFDFNFGVGSDANPLIFPLGAPTHTTFQAGEFDLFISSQLSPKLSFVSELVVGADQTNYWGLDIERLQLTYKHNKYFEISAGRYHTAIGYYNTAYHHGTWFQTTTGRPFMYFFEDSGGILPVHSVGVSTSGLVPGTDKLGLHWIAEIGNGRNSDPTGQPVQNFLSDKNHKDFNLAAFIAPEWLRGLQIGGSYYRDRMVPQGIPHVQQNIESLYAIYLTPTWEFFNEAVALNNRIEGTHHVFHTPLMYTQLSRKFGIYRPYFRYQYVNSPSGDPVNIYTGRYMGPSVGLRIDFADYAAFKLQYNRLDQRGVAPGNGLDAQIAFTF